ncbi:MAG: 30S ribosomal protein S20 [Chthoniobacterales bacterium]
MANIKSAAKRARQAVKRTSRNSSTLSAIKTEQKKLRKAITAGDAAATKTGYSRVASALDKAAKRGIIHKNAAARGKSKLGRALKKTA